MLKNKTVIAVFINCLLMTINAGIMLYKWRIDYLLMIVCSYYKVLPSDMRTILHSLLLIWKCISVVIIKVNDQHKSFCMFQYSAVVCKWADLHTHPETLTVCVCSGLKPLGLEAWSMDTERPRLPSVEAGMDTSVTVWGILEQGESGRVTGVTIVW